MKISRSRSALMALLAAAAAFRCADGAGQAVEPAQAAPVTTATGEIQKRDDTFLSLRGRWRAMVRQMVLDTLRSRPPTNPEIPMDIEAFATHAASFLVITPIPEWTIDAEIGAEFGERLTDLTDDPLVRALGFAMLDDWQKSRSMLSSQKEIAAAESFVAAMEAGGDPALLCWRMARRVWVSKVNRGDFKPEQISIARATTQAAMVKACEQAIGNPEMERMIVQFFRAELENEDCRYGDDLVEQLDASKASVWLKGTLAGKWYVKQAWRNRGGKFANEVTDAQWTGFHKEIRRARARSQEAYQNDPSRPEPCVPMITVCGAEGDENGETVEVWLDRALRAQTDWKDAWEQAFWFSRDRWGGSEKQRMAIARRALKTQRFDTPVPANYLSGLWDVARDRGDFGELVNVPGVAKDLDALEAGYLDKPSSVSVTPLSECVIVNLWLNRIDNAKRLADRLDKRFRFDSACSSWRMYPEQARMLHAYGKRTGEIIRRADEAARLQNWDDAEKAISQAESLDGLDESERLAIATKRANLRFARQWSSGEWAPLSVQGDGRVLCNPNFNDRWTLTEDGTIAAAPNASNGTITFVPEVGSRFEFSATLSDSGAKMGLKSWFAVYVDVDHENSNNNLYQEICFYPRLKKWVLGTLPVEKNGRPFEDAGGTFQIRVVRFDDKVMVWLNGVLRYKGNLPEKIAPRGTRIGFSFSTNIGSLSPQGFKLDDAKVRVLSAPPNGDPGDKRIE